ncbi:MAG: rod shape-determining protein RodA [Actinomycetota bacterium]|nr:rod shape-determining protein RodA [Actinomycetota bacterium]
MIKRKGPVDTVLVGGALAIAVLGVVVVASATRSGPEGTTAYVARQLAWVALGTVVMLAAMAVDVRRLRRAAPVIYGLVLVALVAVLSPLGAQANGAQAWFDLGAFRVQPAELAKPALIAMLAAHGARARGRWSGGRFLGALLLAAPAVGLTLLQPDLGTAIVLAVVTAGVVVTAGARTRHLVLLAMAGLLGVVGVIRAGILEPYQVERLTGFLHQSSDPRGATWNLEQAKIAIGSGGVVGAGLFAGSQTALDYVPEAHTDFVFTVVGEELGFLGGASLLGLFSLLAWRIWRAAVRAPDAFSALCCTGALTMFGFQVFENVGMTMGLTPITGIPLPLVSYGGSATVACLGAIGVVANISRA